MLAQFWRLLRNTVTLPFIWLQYITARPRVFLLLTWFKSSTELLYIFFSPYVILQKRHHVLQTVHPSPLSAHRGFFGCKHFSKTNELLLKSGKKPIDWKALWVYRERTTIKQNICFKVVHYFTLDRFSRSFFIVLFSSWKENVFTKTVFFYIQIVDNWMLSVFLLNYYFIMFALFSKLLFILKQFS